MYSKAVMLFVCLKAGLGTKEEFGQLSLKHEENFCMGGPGVILSRDTLVRVGPHINYCLRHLLTGHEDVELGRCIYQFAGVTCTWSYEVCQSTPSLPEPHNLKAECCCLIRGEFVYGWTWCDSNTVYLHAFKS